MCTGGNVMKKFSILALTLIMMLGLVSVTWASTVSLDVWSGGEVEQNSYTTDLSQVAIGLEIPINDFKFACNLTSGTILDYKCGYHYYDVDAASFLLKGGYALVNNKKLRLDVTAGFYDRVITYDDYDNDEDSYYSITAGFDAQLKLTQKAWINFSYTYGLAPQGKNTYYDDSDLFHIDSISLLNSKFNVLFTRQFGMSLGYHYETIDFDSSYKEKYSSFTLGVFYKF
jgi:hypothetical protein